MRDQVVSAAHDSTSVLKICQEMANGTKHFGQRPGAQHDHMDTEITPGRDSVVDCKIDVNGTIRSGLAIARECVAEWERIFEGAGLSIERRS